MKNLLLELIVLALGEEKCKKYFDATQFINYVKLPALKRTSFNSSVQTLLFPIALRILEFPKTKLRELCKMICSWHKK